MPFRVLAFSDIHGHKKGLDYIKEQVLGQAPDLVLIAGDATDHSDPASTLSALDGLGAEVFLVPGNMDRFASVDGYPNITDIHADRHERGGIGFVGFGAVHMGDMDLTEFLSPFSRKGDVLLTHFPAQGFNDRTRSGNRAGSSRIARAVTQLGFRLLVSGHIHESPGIVQEGGVYYVNPGPAYEHRGLSISLGEETLIKRL